MEKRRLYMDYAATTPVKPEVLEAMMPYYTTYFGNASSFHQFGREAKEGLDKGRAQVASLINADPREVYFTNGGSESDNWALEGTAFASGMGIASPAFSMQKLDDRMRFLSKGKGHGLGFSQYGGDALAKEGKTWQEILHIYFPLMEIETEDFDYI